ncbi:hypothetical protein T8A63_19755 (plasmid) [Sulfitobacter sp. OXR-159]|uniref:hypothetical protein n=1 Tax=Sulfitobacter sp. OXR-159 TaxID=3100174 RepID=UPI002AC8E294|nr:hypothetical protein [Sulfitobacter sp. OXR-159]WPZ31565.1 hypothetical protein T8A63_19755 [Sulfitobacter sp. OXR-159]
MIGAQLIAVRRRDLGPYDPFTDAQDIRVAGLLNAFIARLAFSRNDPRDVIAQRPFSDMEVLLAKPFFDLAGGMAFVAQFQDCFAQRDNAFQKGPFRGFCGLLGPLFQAASDFGVVDMCHGICSIYVKFSSP